MKATILALALAATLAGAQTRANGWDKAAFVFYAVGILGVAPTMAVGVIADVREDHGDRSWQTAKYAVAGITVGAMVTGWALQGVAAWSHHESIVPDFGVGLSVGNGGVRVRVGK
jgi:hypothetical protein